MKKVYSKPEIFFECFRMSSSIANTCAVPTVDEPFEPNGMGFEIFVNNCAFTPDDERDGVCYQNPNDDTRIFSS